MRTPGCGAADVAWTPVEPPSNVSHADDFSADGASDERRARGLACSVAALGGAITGVCGGVPFAVDFGGAGGAPGSTTVTSLFFDGTVTPPSVRRDSPVPAAIPGGFCSAAVPAAIDDGFVGSGPSPLSSRA